MADFIRVRDPETGHEFDVARLREGLQVVDDEPSKICRPPVYGTPKRVVEGAEPVKKKSVVSKRKDAE